MSAPLIRRNLLRTPRTLSGSDAAQIDATYGTAIVRYRAPLLLRIARFFWSPR